MMCACVWFIASCAIYHAFKRSKKSASIRKWIGHCHVHSSTTTTTKRFLKCPLCSSMIFFCFLSQSMITNSCMCCSLIDWVLCLHNNEPKHARRQGRQRVPAKCHLSIYFFFFGLLYFKWAGQGRFDQKNKIFHYICLHVCSTPF